MPEVDSTDQINAIRLDNSNNKSVSVAKDYFYSPTKVDNNSSNGSISPKMLINEEILPYGEGQMGPRTGRPRGYSEEAVEIIPQYSNQKRAS